MSLLSFLSRAMVLLLCAAFTGCTIAIVPQRFYVLPPLSGALVARMWENDREATGMELLAKVVAIDGQPVKSGNEDSRVLEVLPGGHKVTVRSRSGAEAILSWDAKAGSDYKVFVNRTNSYTGSGLQWWEGTPQIMIMGKDSSYKIIE